MVERLEVYGSRRGFVGQHDIEAVRCELGKKVWHLPFTWPEEPKKTDWQPPEMSPLIKFHLEEIKKTRQDAAQKEMKR